MTWREELRRVRHPDGRLLIGASFRGVPFFVAEGEARGGRRLATHEFPGRDFPSIDDLGRVARVFSVEAYVIGDDYLAQKRLLMDALDNVPGAGELVHPYYGTMRALCGPFRIRETARQSGIATFSIEFHQATEIAPPPISDPDHAEQVEGSADTALEATEEELAAEYDTSGQPARAVVSLSSGIAVLGEGVSDALSPVVRGTQQLARLDADLKAVVSQSSSLARAPRDAFTALRDALLSVADTARSAPREVLRALLDAYFGFSIPPAAGTTATRERERANQAALQDGLGRVLVIEAARLLPRVEFETIGGARAQRDAVVGAIDEQLETAGDTAYPALVELRARVVRAVPGDAELARVLTIERLTSIPSLVLAYQLYGSVDREQDLLDRNSIRNPSFVVGELEVLSQ